MKHPSGKSARKRPVRAVPRPKATTHSGSVQPFADADAGAIEAAAGHALRITPAKLADHLNFLCEDFLIRYALHNAPSSDSECAEWCEAIVRDAESLLALIGVKESGYPYLQMPLDARQVLTRPSGAPDLTPPQWRNLKLGKDGYDALDRIPGALWVLRATAKKSAAAYRELSAFERPSNARQPQHVYLLGFLAQLFEHAFGHAVPPSRPNPTGPFMRFVDCIRLRLCDGIERAGGAFTSEKTDQSAARRLRHFTPTAAATLWAREHDRITKGLWLPRFGDKGEQSAPDS